MLGVVEVACYRKTISGGFNLVREYIGNFSVLGKCLFVLLLITFCFLCLSALGPPTDADSLDYHLGVPLETLRDGGAYPRNDRISARLVGTGEYLNMFGLAAGTDIFGACLQVTGLALIVLCLSSISENKKNRIFIQTCCLGVPVLLPLVATQKPQMLPTAANLIGLILIARKYTHIEKRILFVSLSCVFFAISCKYSFILTGGIIIVVGIVAGRKNIGIGWTIGITVLAYVFLFFPHNLQKLVFYGDPLSPLLERFFENGKPEILTLMERMRAYVGSKFWFPFNLIVPTSIGNITTILGIGCVIFVIPFFDRGRRKIYLWCAVFASILITVFSQKTARFFIEPYFWAIASIAGSEWSITKKILLGAFLPQLIVTSAIAAFATVIMLPGAISQRQRDRVMARYANGYAAMKWIDKKIPANCLILVRLRTDALVPRPHVPNDVFLWLDVNKKEQREEIVSLFRNKEVKYIVTVPNDPLLRYIGRCITPEAVETKEFFTGTRNPRNRTKYTLSIFPLNDELSLCFEDSTM